MTLSFAELNLIAPLTRALSDEGYTTPTPIQGQTIPAALTGRDIVGIAQTGTGKTAAFALPILQQLGEHRARPERKSCHVLVLSPTRELSGQIADSFRTYGRHMRINVALAIGGVPIGRQIRSLQNGVDVLVVTPGRLLDLMNEGAVKLDQVRFLVLDEADRMLDMGFIRDIRKIVAKVPSNRQTMLFSATMPREIEELSASMLRDPARVAVTPVATTAERIAQKVFFVDRAGKPALLAEVLREEPVNLALVFTRTKHGADKVVRQLELKGIAAEAIHGNKSQNQRDRVLAAFRDGKIKTLIATDIAARGIDVEGITHVINYDLPNIPETYVHRIGRTARAGAEGIAISFCDGEERAFLRDIEKLIRMPVPAIDKRDPNARHSEPRAEASGPRNNGGGGRHAEGRNQRNNGNGQNRNRNHRNGGGDQQKQRGANGSAPRNGASYNGEIGTATFMRPSGDDRRNNNTQRKEARAPR